MLPLIIGVGIAALLYKTFSEDSETNQKKGKQSRDVKKKLFISFAIEDRKYRDLLVSQAKNERSPFSFVDMSVKEPWNEHIWKQKCRQKIQKCDGMIVLLSKNTWHASGLRWEIKCAKEEKIPVIGMHVKKKEKGAIPPELSRKKVIDWTWDGLDDSIKRF